jgi:hypothetical protein
MEPDSRVERTLWAARNLTQCADPWHKYYEDPIQPLLKSNQTLVDYFFEDNGIAILDRVSLPNPDHNFAICEACGCYQGSTLYVKVDAIDAGRLIQQGFIKLSPYPLLPNK